MSKFRHKRYGQGRSSRAEGSVKKSYCVVNRFRTKEEAVDYASGSGGSVKVVKHPYVGNPNLVKRKGTYRDNPKLFVHKHKYNPNQHDEF